MTSSGTVAVVGLGYAGRRFARVLSEIRDRGEISMLAVVDRDPARTTAIEHDVAYTNIDECLARLDPAHVCVCTNERDHYEVFSRMYHHGSRSVMSEKPLVTTEDDIDQAARLLQGHELRMNLLERCSEALSAFAHWRRHAGKKQEILQIEAFWGKHRVHDPRPTMGVLSELIHPVDLCLVIVGSSDLRIRSVGGQECSWTSGSWCDAIDLSAVAGRVPLTVHSSFSWPRRDRRVVLLIRVDDELFRAMLMFDNPHWDQDQLHIERITPGGRYDTVLWWESPEAGTGSDGLNKLRRSVDSWLCKDDALPDLANAVRLQRIIRAIDRSYRTERGKEETGDTTSSHVPSRG